MTAAELVKHGNELGMWLTPIGLVFWAIWALWQWGCDRWKS